LLECQYGISAKETIKIVTSLSGQIADAYGENVAIVVSKAKKAISDNAEISSFLSPREIGKEVFGDCDEMAYAFEEKLDQMGIPQKINVDRAYAIRSGKNHKIRTDTGIEMIIPAEHLKNNLYVEFINNPDGTISIEMNYPAAETAGYRF
jgi:hypothetical protein